MRPRSGRKKDCPLSSLGGNLVLREGGASDRRKKSIRREDHLSEEKIEKKKKGTGGICVQAPRGGVLAGKGGYTPRLRETKRENTPPRHLRSY